jgi:hypothetical protein
MQLKLPMPPGRGANQLLISGPKSFITWVKIFPIRSDEFAGRISDMTGQDLKETQEEVQLSIERLFTYAAWAG